MIGSDADVTRALYSRWADRYPPLAHNPLMRAEQEAMLRLWPPMTGRRVLDLACGSGRYARLLTAAGAAMVLALDDCWPMLRQVAQAVTIQGSMMSLPFASASFDAVICGLAVGHASDLERWMGEVARVLAPGGVLVYSDFHPQAVAAGHLRSFRDSDGSRYSVPHHPHSVAAQRRAATAAGLNVEALTEVRVGVELCEDFPGSAAFYRRRHGLPVVLAVRAVN